jgi:hypothetical protein
MTVDLPDSVWFLVHRRRLWPIRREGRVAILTYYFTVVPLRIGAGLMAAFIHPWVGLAVAAIGFGLVLWRFLLLLRRHADYTVRYDDYMRAQGLRQ